MAESKEISYQQYADADGWRQSALKLLPGQPEEFESRYIDGREDDKPSAAREFGTALDALVLSGVEPVVVPAEALNSQGHRRGKAWTAFKEEHAGELLFTPLEAACLNRAKNSLLGEKWSRMFLQAAGPVQLSIFWDHPATGLPLKARLDKLAIFGEARYPVDLKTTRADPLDERQIGLTMADYQYHRQAAWYMDAVEALYGEPASCFTFIFTQNTPPWRTAVYEMPETYVNAGRLQNEAALEDLGARLNADNWLPNGYGQVRYPQMPEWALNNKEVWNRGQQLAV